MKRKIARALGRSSAITSLVIGIAGAGMASAAPASASSEYFWMLNGGSGQCMHASAGGQPGSWVTQEYCNRAEINQLWRWTWDGQGRKVLQNGSGYCLDGYNGQNPGTVIVWICNGSDSQAWKWGVKTSGLENYGSGKSIEPPGQSTDHNQLIMWPTNGTAWQTWTDWRY